MVASTCVWRPSSNTSVAGPVCSIWCPTVSSPSARIPEQIGALAGSTATVNQLRRQAAIGRTTYRYWEDTASIGI